MQLTRMFSCAWSSAIALVVFARTSSGSDGEPYSADTFVDPAPDAAGRYGAALLFVRWAEGQERPLGHLETDYLAFASTPLYGAYAALAHRPGGLSALADQQLAAGVMWVPGSLAYLIAGFISVYRWLEPGKTLEPRSEELSWT